MFDDSAEAAIPERRPISPAWGWGFLALVAFGGLIYSVAAQPKPKPIEPPPSQALGQKLLGLNLGPMTAGSSNVTLEDLKGKVALVHFWGTWCGPCVAELPELLELEAKYHAQPNFRMLLIATAGSDPDVEMLQRTTIDFVQKRRIQTPVYADLDDATRQAVDIAEPHGRSAVPLTVIIDGNAVIRGLWIGGGMESIEEMDVVLKRLLDPAKTETAQQ